MNTRTRHARRLAYTLGAAAGAAGLTVALAGAASAATTTPGYGHQHECHETLTYEQEGDYGGQFVEVDNVCFAVIIHEGYGRHHHGAEDVFYQTERHGSFRDHDVRGVRDAEVSYY